MKKNEKPASFFDSIYCNWSVKKWIGKTLFFGFSPLLLATITLWSIQGWNAEIVLRLKIASILLTALAFFVAFLYWRYRQGKLNSPKKTAFR